MIFTEDVLHTKNVATNSALNNTQKLTVPYRSGKTGDWQTSRSVRIASSGYACMSTVKGREVSGVITHKNIDRLRRTRHQPLQCCADTAPCHVAGQYYSMPSFLPFTYNPVSLSYPSHSCYALTISFLLTASFRNPIKLTLPRA